MNLSRKNRRGAFYFVAFAVAGHLNAQVTHPAINQPDQFAWSVFNEITRPADPTKPDGPVVWETWALARDIFADPNKKPKWPGPGASTTKEFEALPLQQRIFRGLPNSADSSPPLSDSPSILVDPNSLPTQGNETRLNREAFDFVADNDLYYIEGQEAVFNQGKKIDFPIPSKEIKAQWRPIRESDKPRYHWTVDKGRLWGLTSIHITTKDLPNWFWATWEHKDNQGREAVVPSRDSAGLPEALKNTKWENYVLRGTQVDFVSQIGQPIILASSQVEHGFQTSSSCMTCHARATVGEIPRLQFQRDQSGRPVLDSSGKPIPLPRDANRLSVFEGENGSIGIPSPSWYVNTATFPPTRSYIQMDFVWSLDRARRRLPVPPVQALTERAPTMATITKPDILTESPFHSLPFNEKKRTVEDVSAVVKKALPRTLPVPPSRMLIPLDKGERLPPDLRKFLTESSFMQEKFSGRDRICALDETCALEDHTELLEQHSIQRDVFYVRPPTLGLTGSSRSRNMDAAISHLVPQLRGNYDLKGTGLVAAVFDEGGVRASHREFLTSQSDLLSTRVSIMTTQPLSDHSTHVAGTIGARGQRTQAMGMAPGIQLQSYDWNDDLQTLENLSVAAVTNHSYGKNTGWTLLEQGAWGWWGDSEASSTEDWAFGAYTPEVSKLDGILAMNPSLVTVVAAGNDRNDAPGPDAPLYHVVRNELGEPLRYEATDIRYPADNSDQGGLDTISGLGISKNAITIGSIEDITTADDTIRMTDYSSWGPADDFRIKPDLVANGDWLLSTSSFDDSSYVEMPGTSMASPVCAGICALLIEHYATQKQAPPLASDIKAVLIHSARPAGKPGPDPVYGWGSIDALKAGRVIASENGEMIEKLTITQGEPRNFTFTRNGTSDIKVTAVWTDPPWQVSSRARLDDRSPALMNDIDILLTGPDGTIYHPWTLAAQEQVPEARRTGANHVDNVEVIEIDAAPATGKWQLTVKDSGFKGPALTQQISLVISGLRP